MKDIIFGNRKEDIIVKPKAKFIPCVKNTENKISIKKEDAVLIGKIDIKNIPIIKEKEETLRFLENSDGFYDGKSFGSIENAKDFTNFGIERFSKISDRDVERLFFIEQKYGVVLTEDIQNENYKEVFYKVKTVKEFSKI